MDAGSLTTRSTSFRSRLIFATVTTPRLTEILDARFMKAAPSKLRAKNLKLRSHNAREPAKGCGCPADFPASALRAWSSAHSHRTARGSEARAAVGYRTTRRRVCGSEFPDRALIVAAGRYGVRARLLSNRDSPIRRRLSGSLLSSGPRSHSGAKHRSRGQSVSQGDRATRRLLPRGASRPGARVVFDGRSPVRQRGVLYRGSAAHSGIIG